MELAIKLKEELLGTDKKSGDNMSLIERYLKEEHYYQKLKIGSQVDKETVIFLECCSSTLKHIDKSVSIEYFRNYKFEEVIDGYCRQLHMEQIKEEKKKEARVRELEKKQKEEAKKRKEESKKKQKEKRNLIRTEKIEQRNQVIKEIQKRELASHTSLIHNMIKDTRNNTIVWTKKNTSKTGMFYIINHSSSYGEKVLLRKVQLRGGIKYDLYIDRKNIENKKDISILEKVISDKKPELMRNSLSIGSYFPTTVLKEIVGDKKASEKKKKPNEMQDMNQDQILPTDKNKNEIGIRDFVVRKSIFRCMHANHELENIDAVLRIVGLDCEVKTVKVPAGYCRQCNVYFIMESTYQNLKLRGTPLCRVSDEKTYLTSELVNGMRLSQKSILMEYGYNVSQGEDLSSSRRHKILAVLLDNKVLSKAEIISYLDFFIRQRQYQSRYEIAVCKWEQDREFVENYKTGHYTQYGVSAIYRV